MHYKKMYCILFNAITDALKQMEQQNFGKAKELLVCAQLACEELYVSAEDTSEEAS